MGTIHEKNRSFEIIQHICICTEFAFIKFKLRYIPEEIIVSGIFMFSKLRNNNEYYCKCGTPIRPGLVLVWPTSPDSQILLFSSLKLKPPKNVDFNV